MRCHPAGGHYVPNLAAALIDAKRAGGARNVDGINLQGFLVGALLVARTKSRKKLRQTAVLLSTST